MNLLIDYLQDGRRVNADGDNSCWLFSTDGERQHNCKNQQVQKQNLGYEINDYH